MAKKEKKKVPFVDNLLFYFSCAAGVFLLASLVPVIPWRMSKADTNVGARFVMDRYYYMFSATDNFGKSVGWFNYKKVMKRKAEEFGRPSPLTAIVGTVGSMMGAGGAAMGCATWEQCKQHVNARYNWYSSISVAGICAFMMCLISCGCTAGVILFMGFEGGEKKKKKKKKKEEDGLTLKGKTSTVAIFAWIFSFMGVAAFHFVLDMALKDFKKTAYYPYASSYVGAFVAFFACFLQFICMVLAIFRTKKPKEVEEGEFGEDPMAMYGGGEGGYGMPPPGGGYPPPGGGYPPPGGGYPPPGGYGGYPPPGQGGY